MPSYPRELAAKILQHTNDIHLLVQLNVLNLPNCSSRCTILSTKWCMTFVLHCTPTDIIKLYTSGHQKAAEAIIELHIDAQMSMQQPNYRNGTAGVGLDLLDTAIKYGTPTKLLVRISSLGRGGGRRTIRHITCTVSQRPVRKLLLHTRRPRSHC